MFDFANYPIFLLVLYFLIWLIEDQLISLKLFYFDFLLALPFLIIASLALNSVLLIQLLFIFALVLDSSHSFAFLLVTNFLDPISSISISSSIPKIHCIINLLSLFLLLMILRFLYSAYQVFPIVFFIPPKVFFILLPFFAITYYFLIRLLS